MKKIIHILLAIVVVTTQISCGDGKQQPEEKKGEDEVGHEDEHTDPDITSLTFEQIQSIGLETGFIEEKQLTASIKANGALRVPNQNKASVNSLYSGIVRSLLIQPGNTVTKGQVIATVANPDFIRSQEEYLSLHPRIVLAEQEYNRQKELNAGNAGALKNLQAAESELQSLRTRKAALEQQIRLMGINPLRLSNGKLISVLSLQSPISGIVSNVSVRIGSYVDLNTPIAGIVDNSQLHLDLFVYEKDLPKLKNDQRIHFTLTNNPGKEYDARIYSLGSTFEDESKAVSVHARVDGDKTGLIDGMTITALISLDKITTPAVPDDAIVTYKGQDYIFIVSDTTGEGPRDPIKPGSSPSSVQFGRIAVAKGTSEVGYTQITVLKPVPAHARIVTKGAFFVLAKMTSAGDGEHGH